MSRRSPMVAAAAITLLASACTNGSTPSGGSSSSGWGNVKEAARSASRRSTASTERIRNPA